ncbi:MAG: gamma-glutamyl-gamma-aminobutyrate hydrolase [Rhodocyclales bacterium GT-UBC]|nr:MAG: gamma-glutamyl-gamma-aminobutyrate hydrolase [Rhodocyclales bacterium GT-UBC]
MKVVAVSQRVDEYLEYEEVRDTLDQRVALFLAAAGGLCAPVPNRLGAGLNDWLTALKPAAIVLSGGNNLGQCAARDTTEHALLDYARLHRLPVLGICRGMQMMAHWAGTGLRPVQGHVRTRHHLSGKITGEANSYHGFSLTDCPSGFAVLARSEDGEIEAIRHESLPWEGWMWHPERESTFATRDVQRLKALLS